VLGLLLLVRGAPGFRWSAPHAARARFREALGFGMPLQLANGIAVFHQQLGKLLIVRLVSLASVVPYELGLRVSTACSTFSQLLLVAMIPEASALHAHGSDERLRELHRRAGRFVTGVAAVVTAALLASAPALFAAWMGHPEPQAAMALRGLSLAAFGAVAAGVSSVIARGVGRTSLELEWSGLALAIHALAGVLLVPRFGLAGALAAIALANLVSALWYAFRLTRVQGWPVARALWEPFVFPALAIATGGAAGAAVGAQVARVLAQPWIGLIVSSVVAGAVALVALLVTRHLAWRELVGLARRGVAS
jgi:O-antigen/teichoic acid export membrane protein